MSTYAPRPIDTSDVRLSEEQGRLVETLAANAHEVWAGLRMRDGWRHGPERDDALKTHPCLVPFAELPEGERKYDRCLAEQIIKAMIAMGYRIEAG